MSNGFMSSFLERNNGMYVPPVVVFEDPRPYMHFITMPIMQSARAAFLKQLENTLPRFEHPVRIMDIGCGDGSLTAEMLDRLRSSGKVDEYSEVLLIDGSAGMIEMARKLVAGHAPDSAVKSSVHRIEEISDQITGKYDIVVSSLAYHHMPWEKKVQHLTNLRPHFENIIFFDLDANNDTPELGTPELSVSVFQSYGRLMDFVFAHDTSIELAVSCVDQFLVPEVISLLTEKRGRRRDYHMLRSQWHQLQQEVLGPEFTCWSDSLSYADEYIGLFTMHYGRS
jgi:SAM-dependent methyltransferase